MVGGEVSGVQWLMMSDSISQHAHVIEYRVQSLSSHLTIKGIFETRSPQAAVVSVG